MHEFENVLKAFEDIYIFVVIIIKDVNVLRILLKISSKHLLIRSYYCSLGKHEEISNKKGKKYLYQDSSSNTKNRL